MAKVRSALGADSVGSVQVEYLVVVGAVSIGLAAAVAAIGPILAVDFANTRAFCASPEVD